jgi:DNA invertase Pin-like site-specific DNA recombinase
MTVIGYARVSTSEQNLDIQEAALSCKPFWTSCVQAMR